MTTAPPRDGASARPALAERLSVVLLTYNCAHRLDEVLAHLCALEVPIIAVDNASGDGTRERLARTPGVELVALPANIGAAARNEGVARARTPHVAFCDDDGWYDAAGLATAADLLDDHPALAAVNARILVGAQEELDPISGEMAQSPLADEHGIPGAVLLSFMGGAVIVRTSAYRQVGGYDTRFFLGGEEETLAFKWVHSGWQMRYVPSVVMHHRPSLANFRSLRAHGMRNTLWNAWVHRRLPNALRWTAFTLLSTPKDRDFARGLAMALRGAPWVARRRRALPAVADAQLRLLDERRFRAHPRTRWLARDAGTDTGHPDGSVRAGDRDHSSCG